MTELIRDVIIQKYGGTSVGSPERLKEVARRIIRSKESGDQIVVVVSAMGNTTDELIELAHRVSPVPARRELDMLLSVGERISMTLLSMAINDLGHQAISFTGSQSGIITDDRHTNARIVEVRASRIQEELKKDKVVIVAGYQGVSRSKEVTTLGRGGSDTTAIALAAALGARVCEIYTDVDGVYTADPDIVKDARKHDHLSFDEMLSLSTVGGTVLQKEAAEYAKKHGIEIEIKSSFSEVPGTLIRECGEKYENAVIGIMQRAGLVALSLCGEEGQNNALELMKKLSAEGMEVLDFLKFEEHLFLTVAVPDQHERSYLESAARGHLGGCDYTLLNCGSVSIVSGTDANMSRLYPEILRILHCNSIPIYGVKKEFTSINVYTEEKAVPRTSNLFHEEFISNRSRRTG